MGAVISRVLLPMLGPLSYSMTADVLSTFSVTRFPMKTYFRVASFVISLLSVCGFTECYKPVTKSQLPEHIKTVAVQLALRHRIEAFGKAANGQQRDDKRGNT